MDYFIKYKLIREGISNIGFLLKNHHWLSQNYLKLAN